MYRNLYFLSFVLLLSCGGKADVVVKSAQTPTGDGTPAPVARGEIMPMSEDTLDVDDMIAESSITCWVLVADTGRNYYMLREKMLALKDQMKLDIDTMDRIYDPEEDLICLPEDSEDEIYAGQYFPRRYPSSYLSLEYLDFYQGKSTEKTMALVTAITQDSLQAAAEFKALKKFASGCFQVKSDIYMGCMH